MQQTVTRKTQHGSHELAFNHSDGSGDVGVVFCGGFNSNRKGQKALALEGICARRQIPYTRFDYSGHGDSDGEFAKGSIDSWLADTLCIIDLITEPRKQIIIGSSMGAWIALLASIARPDRIAGLVTIAAAPDFTERLMLKRFSQTQIAQLTQDGAILIPSEYDNGSPYPISKILIDESRQHCILDKNIELDIPVRMLHGTGDTDVPYELSIELLNALSNTDTTLTLIKDGDHRLSSPEHLTLLEQSLSELLLQLQALPD